MSVSGPLSGVTVIELAGLGPAPFAAMVLAEMGAEVIRVDRPVPSSLAASPTASDLLNRGKRSIVLDLKNTDAVGAVLDLCAGADMIIEGYRPGVAERLGLGPDAVHQRNPAIVYGRMTGWGQDGPLASSAGHDIGYIAVTGALGAIGDAGGPPQIPLNLVGDFGGGSAYLVMGLLAALFEARTTGRGQVVDAAIVDGVSHLLTVVHALLASGRWTDERGANLLDGGTPYYAVYETSDARHMAVGALEPQFYVELVRLLDLDVDPKAQQDRATWPDLRAKLSERFAERTQAEWAAVFDGTDACVAPVVSLYEAVSHPQVASRGSLIEVDGVLQSRPAPRFSGHPRPEPQRAPTIGADTVEILTLIGRESLVNAGTAIQA